MTTMTTITHLIDHIIREVQCLELRVDDKTLAHSRQTPATQPVPGQTQDL